MLRGRRRRVWFAGLAVAVLVTVGGLAYRWVTDRGPEVPSEVVASVAGPQVRVVHAMNGPEPDAYARSAYLLVEVDGDGDPAQVLMATLHGHGWDLGGEHQAWLPASGDAKYFLEWSPASAGAGPRPDPKVFPLAEYVDRTDARQLLIRIDNPVSDSGDGSY